MLKSYDWNRDFNARLRMKHKKSFKKQNNDDPENVFLHYST